MGVGRVGVCMMCTCVTRHVSEEVECGFRSPISVSYTLRYVSLGVCQFAITNAPTVRVRKREKKEKG